MNTLPGTHFGIIRHAPTLWNEEKRIQGQQDSPLSAKGQTMAEIWGQQLDKLQKWDRILCSDLGRVRNTARLINLSLNLPVEEDARLREQDWGEWTGLTLDTIKKQNMDMLRKLEQSGWDFRPPGGESRRDVLQRSMSSLLDAHNSRQHDEILIVCHEGVIKCLLYHLVQRKFLPSEPTVIKQYHLHQLAVKNNMLSLEKMNSIALKNGK